MNSQGFLESDRPVIFPIFSLRDACPENRFFPFSFQCQHLILVIWKSVTPLKLTARLVTLFSPKISPVAPKG